ncbi:BTAD domain-containing putative transcriptional regulator [Streptomyces sp. NPDC091027]|uniref:BTAD domain-containing putative transcriptional regulator n=1 Tax=Streptomyces sp. NPDC091027 TaxID=3365971 RepID=UPI00381FE447
MRYLILGVTEARDEAGVPLPTGGARLRALLAALALRAGRHVPVAELVDDVWGHDPPRDAPAALQALVARLRRALGGHEAVGFAPAAGYRLAASPDDVDLHRFSRLAAEGGRQLATDPAAAARTLRAALALWRGPALADLPEPARTAHAAAPGARRATAFRDRIDADLRGGATAPAALLPEIEALLRESPYDEPLHAQRLRALRAAGRHADALAAYEDTRRTLAEALGTRPGPELAGLHTELLHSPAPQVPPRGTPPHGAPHPGPAREADPHPLPDAAHGTLRPRLTSFVGREAELSGLREDLARLRLVTLTGPGGSGKTRLAEQAAAAHPEPGRLVELARLDHPSAVPGAVLSALGLRENSLVARDTPAADTDPVTLLVEYCTHRSLLLVLDNCEHVIGAAAELAERLLTHCPGVRILATSREPLAVPGETVRPVEPLPPAPAHQLFADRGAAARPGFTPDEDPAAVAEICRRLDGLPLAIELAAARLRLLTPRQIADRLDDRFRLLTSGSRTVLPRQQTLRAVVDWSWDLLDGAERTVLGRLSVFAGGCDLAAAEAVCADPAEGGARAGFDVADVLGSLVDKSLVLAEPYDGRTMRYRMLETIHEYAAERAAERPADARATARRHAAHYAAFAETAEPLIRSADQLPWIRRLETELDNLRAALHTTTQAGADTEADAETAQRLVFALGWFWWLRNYRAEGAVWTARTLALTPAEPPADTPAYWRHMRLRILDMFLLAESNSAEKFRTPAHRALAGRIKEAFRQSRPETATFPGLLWPATSFLTGETLDFVTDLDLSVANCRRHAGDWELGVVLMLRTHVSIDVTGGLSTIDADLAELHEISRRVGDRWTRAQVAGAAGEIALSQGRYADARTAFEECLRLAREVGAHVEAPFALARIAEAAYCAGEADEAERLLAEADAEADQHGGVYDVSAYARLIEAFLALERDDAVRAREACERARAQAGRTTVPAQLTAGLDTVDAFLTAREHGPQAALATIGPAFAAAVTARCAERLLAGMAEAAALFLADAGRPAESVRALAAATAWRAGLPRSVPEQRVLAGLPERTGALLGPLRRAGEETAGAALTPAGLAEALSGS